MKKILFKLSRKLFPFLQRIDECHDVLVNGWQAIDMDYHTRGKIVLATTINGRDYVKIIDIQREVTMMEYRELSKGLEEQYKARTKWVDSPMGTTVWPI